MRVSRRAPTPGSRELRLATLAQYEGVIANWIVPRLGGVKVSALTPALVVEYIAALRTETTAHGRQGLAEKRRDRQCKMVEEGQRICGAEAREYPRDLAAETEMMADDLDRQRDRRHRTGLRHLSALGLGLASAHLTENPLTFR